MGSGVLGETALVASTNFFTVVGVDHDDLLVDFLVDFKVAGGVGAEVAAMLFDGASAHGLLEERGSLGELVVGFFAFPDVAVFLAGASTDPANRPFEISEGALGSTVGCLVLRGECGGAGGGHYLKLASSGLASLDSYVTPATSAPHEWPFVILILALFSPRRAPAIKFSMCLAPSVIIAYLEPSSIVVTVVTIRGSVVFSTQNWRPMITTEKVATIHEEFAAVAQLLLSGKCFPTRSTVCDCIGSAEVCAHVVLGNSSLGYHTQGALGAVRIAVAVLLLFFDLSGWFFDLFLNTPHEWPFVILMMALFSPRRAPAINFSMCLAPSVITAHLEPCLIGTSFVDTVVTGCASVVGS